MRPERAFAGTIAVGITATVASSAYGSGNVTLGTVFVALGSLALVATFAKWIPLLHRLPLVGAIAPPEEVTFHLASPYGGMTFEMSGASEDVILCAGIAEGRRDEITRVLLNAYVVGTTGIVRCLPDGRPYPDGGLQVDGPDAPYWTASGVTIPLGAFIFLFRVTIPGPGEYDVVFKLQSPDFHDKGDQVYNATLSARPGRRTEGKRA